jgi:hypothetical protein
MGGPRHRARQSRPPDKLMESEIMARARKEAGTPAFADHSPARQSSQISASAMKRCWMWLCNSSKATLTQSKRE